MSDDPDALAEHSGGYDLAQKPRFLPDIPRALTLVALAGLFGGAGCSERGLVQVTVRLAPELDEAEAQLIRALVFDVSGSETLTTSFAAPHLAQGREERWRYHALPSSTTLHLTAVALDANATPIADGTADVTLRDGATAALLQLQPYGYLGPGQPGLALLAGSLGGAGDTDGIGPNARLERPVALAPDDGSHLYLADAGAHTVRKIAIATGEVTTLAGQPGEAGASDGLGAQARFDGPAGLAWVNGALYVCDASLRQIDPQSGLVSSVGPGCTDLAPDGTGSLFLASGSCVRRFEPESGTATEVAGRCDAAGELDGLGADARFTALAGAASDGGFLFLSDGDTLRAFDPQSGAVITLAGQPEAPALADGVSDQARFAHPGGLAWDGVGTLFVADGDNHAIRRLEVPSLRVSTLAGNGSFGSDDGPAPAARFDQPRGLAWDSRGVLWVADSLNHAVRKIAVGDGTNLVSTAIGRPEEPGSLDGSGAQARFDHPWGAVFDETGALYVADQGNDTIRRLTLDGAVTTLVGQPGVAGGADGTRAAATFNQPSGLATDGAGHLFVADFANHTVRQIDLGTATVTTVAGLAGQPGIADGQGSATRFDGPYGLAYVSPGLLYVADSLNHTIRRVEIATGRVSTVAGQPGATGSADGPGASARFNLPCDVASDGEGHLYVADALNATIRELDLGSGQVTTVAGVPGQPGAFDGPGASARFAQPRGLRVDPGSGHLWVADTGNDTVRELDLADGTVITVAGVAGRRGVVLGALPAGLSAPTAVAPGPNGELAITANGENAVLILRR